MNAARALLLPAAKGSQKRTPFWLQRLRAKDLLAVAKGFEDFPIIAETYRDCLRDVLDLAHLEEVLRGVQAGRDRGHHRRDGGAQPGGRPACSTT